MTNRGLTLMVTVSVVVSLACTAMAQTSLQIPTCPTGTTTTISGTVYTPARSAPDPLYNAIVYVPTAPVAPFTLGVSCDRCGASLSGSPLVTTTSGPDGKFTLSGVPAGSGIPLVIQIGRWRRQVTIPTVTACTDNPLTADLTRLPRNRSEGDIPLIAISTGNSDAVECVLRKIGIDDSEFTSSMGAGRIRLYRDNGATAGSSGAGATGLYGSLTELSKYDMVLFPCVGSAVAKPPTALQNVLSYANAGGRVFTSHFSYVWLSNNGLFSGTAAWKVNQPAPASPLTATVNASFPKGVAFSKWLDVVRASVAPGSSRVSLVNVQHDFDSAVAPSQLWLSSELGRTPIAYTFNTPVGTAPPNQCGRVLFNDFHVEAMTGTKTFPAECATGPMTAQEKALEFMLFDLASCVTPDSP